ncbi:MAG: hypothetical protein ACI915_005199, partial [Gammaproteobacteria bacterium]
FEQSEIYLALTILSENNDSTRLAHESPRLNNRRKAADATPFVVFAQIAK